jgi:hypothetical protein
MSTLFAACNLVTHILHRSESVEFSIKAGDLWPMGGTAPGRAHCWILWRVCAARFRQSPFA